MTRFLCVLPAKGRPEQTLECIRRLIGTAGLPADDWHLAVVCDEDLALTEYLARPMQGWQNTTLHASDHRLGYWRALSFAVTTHQPNGYTHLVNLANDLLPGLNWLWHMRAHIQSRPGAGGLAAFNDGIHPGDHAAHFCAPLDLLRRWYPGTLVPLCYDHMYGDTELTARAKELGIFSAAPWAVLYHNHVYTGVAFDDVYRLGHEKYTADKATFERRRLNGWRD